MTRVLNLSGQMCPHVSCSSPASGAPPAAAATENLRRCRRGEERPGVADRTVAD